MEIVHEFRVRWVCAFGKRAEGHKCVEAGGCNLQPINVIICFYEAFGSLFASSLCRDRAQSKRNLGLEKLHICHSYDLIFSVPNNLKAESSNCFFQVVQKGKLLS